VKPRRHAPRNHRQPAPERRATGLTVVADNPLADPEPWFGPEIDPRPVPLACRNPLLAVCGLCGGAGTSTLACLIALAAARSQPDPVLLADSGGPSGAICHYTSVQAPQSLSEAGEHLAAGLPTRQLAASTADGLAVLATGPRFATTCNHHGVELLLHHVRERYALWNALSFTETVFFVCGLWPSLPRFQAGSGHAADSLISAL